MSAFDIRDLRPKGRPSNHDHARADHARAAEHYTALAARAAMVQATLDDYARQLALLRAEMDALVPICDADFVAGPDPYADDRPVF